MYTDLNKTKDRKTKTMPFSLNSKNPDLIAKSRYLNEFDLGRLKAKSPHVVAKLVDDGDTPVPPAPAWYEPKTSEIYIHVDSAKISTKKLTNGRINHYTDDKNLAKLLGLYAHELGHANISDDMDVVLDKLRHSKTLTPALESTITLLEEVRVEAHVIRTNAPLRRALRASFTIILEGIAENPPTTATEAARAWALVHGRTLSGITDPHETLPMDTAARTVVGDDIIDQLGELLQEAVQLDASRKDDAARLVEIAAEWNTLLDIDADDDANGTGTCTEARDDHRDKNGQGRPSEAADESDDADGEGDGEVPADGESAAAGDPQDGDTQDGKPDYGTEGVESKGAADQEGRLSDEAAELAADTLDSLRKIMDTEWNSTDRSPRIANAQEWATKVFGKSTLDRSLRQKEPTVHQRQQVVEAAKFLENLSVPQISKASHAQQMPPGRLRSREGVRRSAERAQGMMVTAKPWKGTKRQHSSAKPLVIGLATDTSGSMRWAEEAVAEFAFVYANAGHRIGARTAAVTFGDQVIMTARPGEVSNTVNVKSADGGTEEADKALAALDGVLHLTDQTGAAKILIVVSDGALVISDETARVSERLHRMNEAGTHIIWVTRGDAGGAYGLGWMKDLEKKLPNLELVGAKNTHDGWFKSIDVAVRHAIMNGSVTKTRR